MEPHSGETLRAPNMAGIRAGEWIYHVISLLDGAVRQLHREDQGAHHSIAQAASLLRKQISPEPAQDSRGRLLAWQVRKVRSYIENHITGPVLVADLCALVQLSASHFARSFKRTCGESPQIALRCGFADHAHFCRQFRRVTGQTPSEWKCNRLARGGKAPAGAPPLRLPWARTRGSTPIPASRTRILIL
jgi:AraC family transcriptional regulator